MKTPLGYLQELSEDTFQDLVSMVAKDMATFGYGVGNGREPICEYADASGGKEHAQTDPALGQQHTRWADIREDSQTQCC